MLNKIIHFSLQNRILVLVASVLLLIGGTYTAFHTEVDVFPDLNAPTVVIMTEANGMAAVLVAAILDGVLGLILDHIPALTLPFDYTVFLTVLVLVWYILTDRKSVV